MGFAKGYWQSGDVHGGLEAAAGGFLDPLGTGISFTSSMAGYYGAKGLGFGEQTALRALHWGDLVGNVGSSAVRGSLNPQGGGWRGAGVELAWDGAGAAVGVAFSRATGMDLLDAINRSLMATNQLRAVYNSCFAADTPLLTPQGSKPIQDFRVGDLLLSSDEHDPIGPLSVKEVQEVFVRCGRILHLHVGGQVIGTTAEHPFYVRDKGWLPAGELLPGDLLSSHDGQWIPVEEVFDTGETATVYNLRIADFHTYFVGCDEWGFSVWAHNQYNGLPDPCDHTIFRSMLEKHGYTYFEKNGKIFKNGGEIDQTHIETLSRLYRRELAQEIGGTVERASMDARRPVVDVEVMDRMDPTRVKRVEKVTIDHYNDGSIHEDRYGVLAKAVGEDAPRPYGSWSEWVHLPRQQIGEVSNPGIHRVIVDRNTGEVFYTTDHYKTYIKVASGYEEWGVFGK